MKDGHPFETDELDQMRVRQRRVLRAVPAWLLEAKNYRLPEGSLSKTADGPYLETEARIRADDLISQLQELIESWHGALSADFLTFLYTVKQEHFSGNLGVALSAEEDRPVTRGSDTLPNGVVGNVGRLLLLLQMADRLASDDYRDPRLIGGE